jgi:hypothetical protein
MNIPTLRKIVSDAYAITDKDDSIPKFATRFTFAENEVIIRVPIYECGALIPTLPLIHHVIRTAMPHLKKTIEDLENDFEIALEGKEVTYDGLHVKGIVGSMTQNSGGGVTANAVTEVKFRLCETTSWSPSHL